MEMRTRALHVAMLFTVGITYSLLFSINKIAAESGTARTSSGSSSAPV